MTSSTSTAAAREPCVGGPVGVTDARRDLWVQVVPADLNAFLLMLARDIAAIAEQLGDAGTASDFATHAQGRCMLNLKHADWWLACCVPAAKQVHHAA